MSRYEVEVVPVRVVPPDYVPLVLVTERRRGCGCLGCGGRTMLALLALVAVGVGVVVL